MRTAIFILCGIGFCLGVHGQDNMLDAGYVELELHWAAELEFAFNGQLKYMVEAEFTLISAEEGGDLYMKGLRFDFFYAGPDETVPNRVVIAGKVTVDHPAGKAICEKAEFDFEAGMVLFTGNPIMYSEQFPDGAPAESWAMDLNNETLHATRLDQTRFSLTSPKDAAKAFHLTEDDILDWPAFLERLKAEWVNEASSPGRHFLSLLEAQTREVLKTIPLETLLGRTQDILKLLNGLLESAEFYDSDSWKDATPSDEAASLLEADPGSVSPVQRVWVNRTMLRLAYPELVGAPPTLPE